MHDKIIGIFVVNIVIEKNEYPLSRVKAAIAEALLRATACPHNQVWARR